MTELADVMRNAISNALEDVHTCAPGRVVSVNGGRVNVQPLLSRRLRDGRTEQMPVVPDIPVWFPSGGGASITWPINAGDGCLLIFAERSIDEWKGSFDAEAPDDPRRHQLTDAIALVGLKPEMEPGQGIVLTMGGVTFTVSGGGVAIEGGQVTHNGINIGSDHVHSGVVVGPGETEGPQ
jgi:hypothetical protein